MKNFLKTIAAIAVCFVTAVSLAKWLGEKSNEKYVVIDRAGNEIF